MASSTDSLFFKKEDSNLTVEKLREMNYLAKETSKGFILVGLFHDLRQRQLNYYSEWEYKEDYKELVKLLSDNLKENAPPIMRLNSSTFGGCFDDEPSLKVYNSEGEKVKVFYDNIFTPDKENMIQSYFNELYKTDEHYYDYVGFFRDDSEIITEEQKQMIKDMDDEKERKEREAWEKTIDLSDTEEVLRRYIFAKKKTDRSAIGNPAYGLSKEQVEQVENDVRFIEAIYGEEDD